MTVTNMLFCTKGRPYHERLTLFNVPTLRNKIIRRYMIMVYKLVSSVGQNSFKNYFKNKKQNNIFKIVFQNSFFEGT